MHWPLKYHEFHYASHPVMSSIDSSKNVTVAQLPSGLPHTQDPVRGLPSLAAKPARDAALGLAGLLLDLLVELVDLLDGGILCVPRVGGGPVLAFLELGLGLGELLGGISCQWWVFSRMPLESSI